MKRLLLTLLTSIICVAATGCGQKSSLESTTQYLSSPFVCDMKMIYDDSEFDGVIERYDTGNWNVLFSAPPSLDGVTLSFSGNDISASYKGLDFTVPKKAIPIKSILGNFIEVVDSAAENGETEGKSENGMLTVEGETEGGDYSLIIDEKTGFIDSFEMKNTGVKIKFENMVISSDKEEITTEEE